MEIKDIENLAELARLHLTEAEKESLLKDMREILSYVRQVSEAKTGEEIEAEYSKYSLRNVWREDELAPGEFSRELLLCQFPDSQDGFLKVKKILNND